MADLNIDLGQIEEWQLTKNIKDIESIFLKAKSTIVQGQTVFINRKNEDGSTYVANEISDEPDLNHYKDSVLKYL